MLRKLLNCGGMERCTRIFKIVLLNAIYIIYILCAYTLVHICICTRNRGDESSAILQERFDIVFAADVVYGDDISRHR